MDEPHFVYPLVRWWMFGLFLLGAVMSNAALNIPAGFVWTCAFISLGQIPRSGIAG